MTAGQRSVGFFSGGESTSTELAAKFPRVRDRLFAATKHSDLEIVTRRSLFSKVFGRLLLSTKTILSISKIICHMLRNKNC